MNSTAHVYEEVHGKVLEVDFHGKLSRSDYAWFVPETEKLILKYDKIRVLLTMHDFYGEDAGALWESIKRNAKHIRHIERLAVVGEKANEGAATSGAFDLQFRGSAPSWHKWITGVFKAFTNTQVRYFTLDELDAARAWINDFQEPKPSEPRVPIAPFMP